MAHALVLGATGLVGGELVKQLLADARFERVTLLVRRKVPLEHPKLRQIVVDFDRLGSRSDASGDAFAGADVFCCLGTTIKKAGSQEAFRRVDHDYPLEAARLAKERGARKYLVITALGSDSSSRIFYNRVKGELEDALEALGLPECHVFHPSILTGHREEHRAGEKLGIAAARLIGPLMIGPAYKYRATPADVLARAMQRAAAAPVNPGFHIHENDEILRKNA